MADFVKTIIPSLATKVPCNGHRVSGLVAGEDIAAGDPCYIKSDGLVYRSNGTADDATAKVHGWATIAYTSGMTVTLYYNCHIAYGPSTATPGAPLYVGTTPGKLSTVATTGGKAAAAYVDWIASGESTPHAVIFALRNTY